MLVYIAFDINTLPPIVAVVPHIIVATLVILVIIIMNWINTSQMTTNITKIAKAIDGNLTKQKESCFEIDGSYLNKKLKIYTKNYKSTGQKSPYYHVKLEGNFDFDLVCVKRYTDSKLNEKARELSFITTGDEEFDYLHVVLTNNPELAKRLFALPTTFPILRELMDKYTELRIHNGIEVLKRYHITMADPSIVFGTADLLSKLTFTVEDFYVVSK